MEAAIIALFTLAVALAASATLLGQAPAATHGANDTQANATLPADNVTPSAPEAMTTAFGALNTSSGAPAVVELAYKHTDHADAADLRLHNGRRLDGYTVQWTCPDFAAWMGFTEKNPPPVGPA